MIIPFPQKPRIVISCARITETRCQSADGGTSVVRHDPPELRFFLEFEDADGCHGVWDGSSHAEAIEAASDWLTDGIEARDRTAGYRGCA